MIFVFFFFSIVIIALCLYMYAKFIEPHSVDWKTITIESPQLPNSFHQFKIIHITDTHLGFSYNLAQFQKHIAVINNQQPNVVVFTGDLTDNPEIFQEREQLILTLQQLHATNGKYAVIGNHDYINHKNHFFHDMMQAGGFKTLNNQAIAITNATKAHIVIAGVADPIFGQTDMNEALSNVTSDTFNILLSHVPDIAFTDARIHLQLSGHTHGGQINIPGLGAIVTPSFGKKFVKGLYKNQHNQLLYVNKGLGTTRLPLRFFCKPEILEIVLVKG